MAYLPIDDFGNPCCFTAFAREVISGGQFVFASGAQNVVNISGIQSFNTTDLLVAKAASGCNVVGMAVENAASGGKITIQTRGLVVSVANADLLASYPLQVDGNEAVAQAGSRTMVSGYMGTSIGRALTAAASGGYCVVNLNL